MKQFWVRRKRGVEIRRPAWPVMTKESDRGHGEISKWTYTGPSVALEGEKKAQERSKKMSSRRTYADFGNATVAFFAFTTVVARFSIMVNFVAIILNQVRGDGAARLAQSTSLS